MKKTPIMKLETTSGTYLSIGPIDQLHSKIMWESLNEYRNFEFDHGVISISNINIISCFNNHYKIFIDNNNFELIMHLLGQYVEVGCSEVEIHDFNFSGNQGVSINFERYKAALPADEARRLLLG